MKDKAQNKYIVKGRKRGSRLCRENKIMKTLLI